MKRFPQWFAAALLVCGAAKAQGTDEFGAYGGMERRYGYESPQNAAFEVRFGRYQPRIDEEFSGATPFETTFGNDTRFIIGFEVDWQALRLGDFASFGPGLGWGYTSFSADAFLSDGTGRAAQETSLEIMPMYLVGVLRVDALPKKLSVPVVPYAKLGVGYALWWVGDGEDTAVDDQGVKGRGSSYGLQWALGGMFLLDIIDRTSAVEIDNTTGVNNTYFFFEWTASVLDGFGAGDQMQVGSSSWTLGLALEI
ncbi:MAG: MXAN_2562 family outer membrane beta-barrel protein [Polyangiaceae bacterium]